MLFQFSKYGPLENIRKFYTLEYLFVRADANLKILRDFAFHLMHPEYTMLKKLPAKNFVSFIISKLFERYKWVCNM